MNYQRVLVYSFLLGSLLWGGQVWGAAGDPLWEQTFHYLPNYEITQPYASAASSNTLIVCGSAFKQTNDPGPPYVSSSVSLGFIRAYDVVTGNLKWQGTPLTLASTQGAQNQNSFQSIIVNGNIAMVQGYALCYTQNSQGFNFNKTILRAYNINTGQLLWENIKDGYGYMQGANTLTTNNRVFITGTDNSMGIPPSSGWVRAYQIPGTTLQGPLLLLE